MLLIVAAAVVALSPRVRARLFGGQAVRVPLAILSTPEGAEVFIDDHFVGATPVHTRVAAQPHRVRVVRSGYQPWHEEVDPVSRPEIVTTLSRVKLARLIIDSEPDRADVFLNEERRGVTPLEIDGVEPGAHTVRIIKEPLYQPIAQRIELKDGETRRISVRLQSGLEEMYVERIKKQPAKLSNYTELLHLHVLNGAGDKAAGTVSQAMEAFKAAELPATEVGQFFDELRKLVKGQAGALSAPARDKLFAALSALLESLVLANPAEYTRYDPLVAILLQAERFEDINKVCEKTVESPAGKGMVHYYVATICLRVGETTQAVRLLERAVQLQPSLLTARLSLASAYHRAERLDEALREYTEAEKLAPQASPYYQGLLQAEMARLMVSRKDIAGAIARYKKAIEAKAPPAYSCQWRLQFAGLLIEQDRKTEATEQYREIVRFAPDSEAGYAASKALRRLGEK